MAKSGWKEERKQFKELRSWMFEKVERIREKKQISGEMSKTERKVQREKRSENVKESIYNIILVIFLIIQDVIKEKIMPECLKDGWEKSRWQRVTRYKLRDRMKVERYWKDKKKKWCRVCEGREETWEHVWKDYGQIGKRSTWQEIIGVILIERKGRKIG